VNPRRKTGGDLAARRLEKPREPIDLEHNGRPGDASEAERRHHFGVVELRELDITRAARDLLEATGTGRKATGTETGRRRLRAFELDVEVDHE
jgi:hypothetical protein